MSSYGDQKPINHNLTFLGVKDGGECRGIGSGRGGSGIQNSTFSFKGSDYSFWSKIGK